MRIISKSADPVPLSFFPAVDQEAFLDRPEKLVDYGEFNQDVDLILGYTQTEGYMLGRMIFPEFSSPDMNLTLFR